MLHAPIALCRLCMQRSYQSALAAFQIEFALGRHKPAVCEVAVRRPVAARVAGGLGTPAHAAQLVRITAHLPQIINSLIFQSLAEIALTQSF